MGKTWDTQTGISPYEAAHPYAVKLERENCKLREERDLYHKQADALWAALERIVDANGRDGRAIARGVMERLRRGT